MAAYVAPNGEEWTITDPVVSPGITAIHTLDRSMPSVILQTQGHRIVLSTDEALQLAEICVRAATVARKEFRNNA